MYLWVFLLIVYAAARPFEIVRDVQSLLLIDLLDFEIAQRVECFKATRNICCLINLGKSLRCIRYFNRKNSTYEPQWALQEAILHLKPSEEAAKLPEESLSEQIESEEDTTSLESVSVEANNTTAGAEISAGTDDDAEKDDNADSDDNAKISTETDDETEISTETDNETEISTETDNETEISTETDSNTDISSENSTEQDISTEISTETDDNTEKDNTTEISTETDDNEKDNSADSDNTTEISTKTDNETEISTETDDNTEKDNSADSDNNTEISTETDSNTDISTEISTENNNSAEISTENNNSAEISTENDNSAEISTETDDNKNADISTEISTKQDNSLDLLNKDSEQPATQNVDTATDLDLQIDDPGASTQLIEVDEPVFSHQDDSLKEIAQVARALSRKLIQSRKFDPKELEDIFGKTLPKYVATRRFAPRIELTSYDHYRLNKATMYLVYLREKVELLYTGNTNKQVGYQQAQQAIKELGFVTEAERKKAERQFEELMKEEQKYSENIFISAEGNAAIAVESIMRK